MPPACPHGSSTVIKGCKRISCEQRSRTHMPRGKSPSVARRLRRMASATVASADLPHLTALPAATHRAGSALSLLQGSSVMGERWTTQKLVDLFGIPVEKKSQAVGAIQTERPKIPS